MTEALRALVNHVFALTPADAIFMRRVRGQSRVAARAGEGRLLHRRRDDAVLEPQACDMAHVNTVLTRASLEFLAA